MGRVSITCFRHDVWVPHVEIIKYSLLISNCSMPLHITVLRECRVKFPRFFCTKLMPCVRPPLESRPRLYGPRRSRETWDGRKKFDLINISWSRTRLSTCPLGQWCATVFFWAGLAQTRLNSRSSSACDWSNCCLIWPGREEHDKQTNLTRQESY